VAATELGDSLIPLLLTLGWMVWEGWPIYPHDESLVRGLIDGRSQAWVKEGCPLQPAIEILDITFAMNLGLARTREQCARRVIYQPAYLLAEDFIYHPTLVGPDFVYAAGAVL
jgi:hypothetical protein